MIASVFDPTVPILDEQIREIEIKVSEEDRYIDLTFEDLGKEYCISISDIDLLNFLKRRLGNGEFD